MTKLQNRRLRLLLALSALSLAACAPARSALTAGVAQPPAPHPQVAAPAGQGGVRVAIVWPERRTAAIPADAESVDVAIYAPGGIFPLQSATLTRGVGTLPAEVQLSPIPAGQVTLRAAAKAASGKILARADIAIDVRSNEIVAVRVPLVPVDKPTIASVTPANGVPGTVVSLFGGAFGATSEYPIEVFLGTGSFKVQAAQRRSDGLITFALPQDAPVGPVVVRVAGLTATSSTAFTPIASLSITPAASDTFAPNGLVELVLTARDSAGNVIGDAYVPFDIAAKTGCVSSCVGGDTLRVDGGVGELNVGAETGRLTIGAGSGSVTASAIVDVHALGRADMPAGIGPLPAVVAPADNATTPARTSLGRLLFFDPKLSRSGAMSCATCHDPAKGFGDGRRFALGNDAKDLPRHAPTILNAAYGASFFWDGRAESLEAQVLGVVGGAREFNSDVPALVAYLAGDATYSSAFSAAYQAVPSLALVSKAIASYERTLVSPANTAGFDRWLAGDDAALSAAAFRGLGLFMGRARCIACHSGPNLTDEKFHNVAIEGSGTLDRGRFELTGAQVDLGAFKTPTLRNVAITAPYFHDGSKETLDEATRHYETFRRDFLPPKSSKLKTVFFVGTDRPDLVEFQEALTATPSF